MPNIEVLESSDEEEEVQVVAEDEVADVSCVHPAASGNTEPFAERHLNTVVNHPGSVRCVKKNAKAASALKAKGNDFFKEKNYLQAIECYSDALDFAPTEDEYNYSRAVYYCNRAACYLYLERFDDVITDCTEALELESRYVKAFTRRAQAFEALDELESALEDINKVVEIEPTLWSAVEKQRKLDAKVKEKHEKMKDEMIGKLKDLGNTVLGKFGMSLDNFKAVQDPNTGSYSISYQQ
mmetsp:Transcript_10276/g.12833  ORF Transcript_10276/g.12833 Transcript_10276/m.12833 type:complete len:239 (-) Transcript_10276:1161-1877(-)|eukprot:CAMPEP_0204825762 /NCGR_PEP_ID=MMETSP1346-20131115/3569_1 /ASSEMBLY_ACC=CAM_ASM_000771 /TAXON_ID=215587 /ORGANISM="Aplanochytrium stocchinoi, Strain GSBS06" /LENGTH=238 /DNA_ID=CAMNT_0051953493 /DNA_START=220 /DNA_END=936 /DNA_ORIENTATION=+